MAKYCDTIINTGGLMRCCMATIQEFVNDKMEVNAPKGDFVIDCKYESPHNKQIKFSDGVWAWNSK